MKIVELECQNCGAALKIDKDSDTISCPYCKATYKIDDEAKHVKYDDMENSGYEFEKGRIKAQKEHINNSGVNVSANFSKVAIIPFVMVAIVMMVILVTSAFSRNSWKKDFANNSSSSVSDEKEEEERKAEEERQKRELESQVHSFNWRYSSGKKSGFFVKSDLNEVINSNRTNNERFITVKFNDIETQDAEEILKIIDQIDTRKDYNVLLDYDSEGFVNSITIK